MGRASDEKLEDRRWRDGVYRADAQRNLGSGPVRPIMSLDYGCGSSCMSAIGAPHPQPRKRPIPPPGPQGQRRYAHHRAVGHGSKRSDVCDVGGTIARNVTLVVAADGCFDRRHEGRGRCRRLAPARVSDAGGPGALRQLRTEFPRSWACWPGSELPKLRDEPFREPGRHGDGCTRREPSPRNAGAPGPRTIAGVCKRCRRLGTKTRPGLVCA